MEESNNAELENPKSIKFQLIPVSQDPNQPAVGEVVERKISEGIILSIGRLVIKDGQQITKGNKALHEEHIWFNSKVVSRTHAEVWLKDLQLYVRDIGSSSGTFLNKMRLSPSGKESRPYAIKNGDILQFGVDFKGKAEDAYKSVTVKLGFHDQSWIKISRNNTNLLKFKSALKSLLSATNPYASVKKEDRADDEENSTECCICIGAIAPYQALFVSPCSHCFHYKCVSQMVVTSPMFQCPLCRQVANLTASVSTDSLIEDGQESKKIEKSKSQKQDSVVQSYPPNADDNISVYSKELLNDSPVDVNDNDKAAESGSTSNDINSICLERAKRPPSLTMRLAEFLGRQIQSSPSDSVPGQNKDLLNGQGALSNGFIPRTETVQLTRPASNRQESQIDLEESIS